MILVFSVGLLWFPCQNMFAHSGGTDRDGCHRSHSTGDEHCHNKRSPGAYEKQMKGYSESRSLSWLWILVSIGIAYLLFKGSEVADDSKDGVSKKVGGARKGEPENVVNSGGKEEPSEVFNFKGHLEEESPEISRDLDEASHPVSVRELYKVRCDVSVFNEHELDVLERYGCWMGELSRGEREPSTKEQREFVAVCREFRGASPEEMRKLLSDYEHTLGGVQQVWLKYLFRLKVEGGNG